MKNLTIVISILIIAFLAWLAWAITQGTETANDTNERVREIQSELDPTTPGPIVELEPQDAGSTTTANWEIALADADSGRSCEMRNDVFGEVGTFLVKYEDSGGTEYIKQAKWVTMEIKVGEDTHKVTLEKVGNPRKPVLNWRIDTCNPLVHCYMASPGTPLCEDDGLPPEMFGELVSFDLELDEAGPTPVKLLGIQTQSML